MFQPGEQLEVRLLPLHPERSHGVEPLPDHQFLDEVLEVDESPVNSVSEHGYSHLLD